VLQDLFGDVEVRVHLDHIIEILECLDESEKLSRRIRPMYESTALIDADRQAVAGVVGETAERSFSESDTDDFLSTQMKLIQSDAVLRPVAQRYDLLRAEDQKAFRANAPEAPISRSMAAVCRHGSRPCGSAASRSSP